MQSNIEAAKSLVLLGSVRLQGKINIPMMGVDEKPEIWVHKCVVLIRRSDLDEMRSSSCGPCRFRLRFLCRHFL